MTAADWQSLKADTVGLKICAPAELAEKTVELADPSPLSMLNQAAIAWGKASRWEVVKAEGATIPICTIVIARFGRRNKSKNFEFARHTIGLPILCNSLVSLG